MKVFTSLEDLVKKELNSCIKRVKAKQKTTERQVVDYIEKLEQEISDLKQRSIEVDQLLLTEDPLHLLQTFKSLNMHQLPTTKDWTQVSIHQPSQEGAVVRALVQLEDTIHQQVKVQLQGELKRVQQYQVLNGRGSINGVLMGSKGINSGRFYFEENVGSRNRWYLGVTTGNMTTQEPSYRPANGFWVISFDGHQYKALEDQPVSLSMRSNKVGVFVDYEEGLVSFHDVGTAELIYCFTGCRFDGQLRAVSKKPDDVCRNAW